MFDPLPARPLTRLAPSPTGPLHQGHLLHLIWVLGLKQLVGGRLLLRMEDHDRARCRPDYEQGIVSTLRALGLTWDVGFMGTRPDAYRQSDTPERYAQALAHLRAQGLLYACDCSRAQLRQRYAERGHTVPEGEAWPYDGHCRARGLSETAHVGLRVRMEASTERFTDLLLGEQAQPSAGDLLLRDRTGIYTYTLCVVVDDLVQQVDWVIRGSDLLAATGGQLQLRRLLGGTAPLAFAHHPLITDTAGRKLSKADGAAAVDAMLAAGVRPDVIWGQAAQAGGLLAEPQPLAVSEFGACVAAALPASGMTPRHGLR